MKGQTGLILGLIIVLIIAVFAVINVDPVTVDFGFGEAEWPLVLVILGSVLMGGLIVGFLGIYKVNKLQRENKKLRSNSTDKNADNIKDTKNENEDADKVKNEEEKDKPDLQNK